MLYDVIRRWETLAGPPTTAISSSRRGETKMTVENIHVTDADSLDAAADLLDLRESYDAYLMRLADEFNAESAISPDDADEPADPSDGLFLMVTVGRADDPEPEPPSPAAPPLRLL